MIGKERRDKRERDKRELRRQLEEEEGLKEIKNMDKEVTSMFQDEVIHISFASHKYNFMINYSHHFLSNYHYQDFL